MVKISWFKPYEQMEDLGVQYHYLWKTHQKEFVTMSRLDEKFYMFPKCWVF